MHGSSHKGIEVAIRCVVFNFTGVDRVNQLIVGWCSCVYDNVCIATLCRFVLKLFMCLLLQHDSRWRHVPL